MLAFVVVLLVAVGVSDSVTLTECELKQQIHKHLIVPTMPNLAAKLACHAKLTSNFSTSTVRTINVTETGHEGKAHKNGQASSITETAENTTEVWTLYGLFQLSDHVACDSTKSPTLNLCKLACSKLIDNDITDDLACVKIILTKITTHEMDDLHKMVALLKPKECAHATGPQYFAHCP